MYKCPLKNCSFVKHYLFAIHVHVHVVWPCFFSIRAMRWSSPCEVGEIGVASGYETELTLCRRDWGGFRL